MSKPARLAALCLGAALAATPHARSADAPQAASPAAKPAPWARVAIPDGENCFALTFHPADPRRALLGTRPGSLWESTDGGSTFTHVDSGITSTPSHGVNSGGIVAHPRVPGLWFFGHERFGAYRSRDNGRTWTMINQGMARNNERHGICFGFDKDDDATIYYGADEGIFKSTDQGDHWVKCHKGLPAGLSQGKLGNASVQKFAVHPKTGAVYAAFYAVGEFEMPGIYQSRDHGASWKCINRNFDGGVDQEATASLIRRLNEIQQDKASDKLKADHANIMKGALLRSGLMKGWAFDLRMSDTNPDVLYAATNLVLIRSDDAGESWSTCQTVKHPRSVAIHPKDHRIVAASGTYQVWLTRDGGATWADVTHNLADPAVTQPLQQPHWQQLTFSPDGGRLFALGRKGVRVAKLGDLK